MGNYLIILLCVLIFGGIALSGHVTMLGLSLWLAAILFTAFAPSLFSLIWKDSTSGGSDATGA